MWPQQAAELALLALLLCDLSGVEAVDAPVSGSGGGARGLRKATQGMRRLRLGARPVRDIGIDSRDDDYLENLERSFRGKSYRELDDNNRGRGFGTSTGRGFAGDARPYDARDSNSGTDRGFGAYRKPYNFDTNERSSDRDVAERSRGRDVADGHYKPTRVSDYHNGNANRNTGLSRNDETDSQRWLKILAEFLKTSEEGRELLRAQSGSLQVGGDGAQGRLPLPVLLVPVAAPGPQCSASPPPLPQNELQPPSDYLPPLPPHDNRPRPPADTTDRGESPFTPDSRNLKSTPNKDDVELLLQLFRQEQPRAPLLPPMLLPESPAPAPAAPTPPDTSVPPPARLRFLHSLLIRAELTVYYADYTEPYTVWYDAQTGSSRVDLHGGTTVLYRTVLPNNQVQRVQVSIERYEDEERRRCVRLTSGATDADRSPPGLPDPEPFSFHGYNSTPDGRMERWTYSLAGQVGELGAARGEALTFRHELLAARVRPDFVIPYKYRVTVDSSVLGPEVDWYEHRYLEVREQQPEPRYMSVDAERDCDVTETSQRLERVDPLREFVMTHRDTRCDTDFDKFKETFDVKYESVEEEAMRKTLLIRSLHFVESANRQGGPALLEVNELSVLLHYEKNLLEGLVDDTEGEDEPGAVGAAPFGFLPENRLQPEPFPYSAEEAADLARQLPAAFSWKRQGAVTHVRNQGLCKTCWAFSVVAAVEGALFLRTGALVPLSDRQLVECAGGHCDRGKHVDFPYRRIRDHGIAALANYTSYDYENPTVGQCKREGGPVTRISGFVRVTNSADALKVAIARHGPNVIEVDSSCDSFHYFKAGVIIDRRCNPAARLHAITAVGFSRHKRYGDYFIAKNSWGLAGNRGYVHLHARSNACGVHTAPSYPLLAADDVIARSRLAALATRHPDEKSIFDTNTASKREFAAGRKKYLADRRKQQQKKQRN
ncbi:uncharacterized protein LOC128677243 [Plodia interpunctella]|uniref:uncharacterized protein LOC128677243 n=1 Tax=Plodia interpunctella TaxID=58824 RepID=UPI002367D8B6|nr:uncharacterized protein LOC128677243 [Plodia interpunctella]